MFPATSVAGAAQQHVRPNGNRDVSDPRQDLVRYQKTLFALYSEFFQRATGAETPEQFATFDSFSEVIRNNAATLAQRGQNAFVWADENIRPFYGQEVATAYRNTKQLGGLKLVQGGGSGFLSTHLASVRGALLYADTVLVPDPVLPWFEVDRTEERFRHVKLVQAVFAVLHLKPLIDADLLIPPVCVFPSFEKSLEDNDVVTQQRAAQLTTDIFAHYVDSGLQHLDDVMQFADKQPERFLEKVDLATLFVAPGGPIGEPIHDALARYTETLETWRSPDWLASFRKLPRHRQVMNGIMERITPHYHLLENADELASHPLITIEQQAHYYRLIADMSNARLTRLQVLDPTHESLIRGLSHERLRWLNNVPTNALIELRRNGENVHFRDRLLKSFIALHDAQLDNIDRVAAEIATEISRMQAEHEAQVTMIQEKYQTSYGQTAVGAWAAVGAAFIPVLAPFVGAAAPFAVAAKYACDKIREIKEIRSAERSLIGVVSRSCNQ